MSAEIYDFLSNVFLFKGLNQQTIDSAIKRIAPEIKEFKRWEQIYAPSDYEHKLCFILSGECSVLRMKSDRSSVPLNTLKYGQSFGIMTILACEEDFPTKVIAKTNCKILLISKDDTLNLIKLYPEIAMNVIEFLSRKISFLNEKIATFSSGNVEEKLSNHILSEYKKFKSLEIPFNCKKSAEAISAGRASLYRALNSLSDSGIIKVENKKIYILDLNGLERKSK